MTGIILVDTNTGLVEIHGEDAKEQVRQIVEHKLLRESREFDSIRFDEPIDSKRHWPSGRNRAERRKNAALSRRKK